MGVPRGPDDPTGPVKPGNSITITSPSNPLVEGEVPENSSASGVVDVDISKKEFRYNPPLHRHNRHRRVDFGYDPKYSGDFVGRGVVYDESGAPRNYTDKWAKANLNSLRLGRIIQHTIAPGHTALMKYRWGFRFLYNPSSVTFASSRNDSFVIDGRSETNRVLSGVNQNYQTVNLSLLLDRLPDVMAGAVDPEDYSPRLRKNDAEGIQRYGTHWDLEALFKVCNGEWNLLDRGKSSNIGVLIPSNSRLILGKGDNLYGFVEFVSYRDILFSQEMVPMRTEVQLTFKRHVDMSAEQVTASFPGIGTVNSGEDSSYEGTVGNDKDAPVPGYNRVTTGFYGYANHNGWDYGAGGIAGRPVHATHSGRVERVRYQNTSYGNHVYIKSGKVRMIYAHMKSINPNLREGLDVKTGDWIGRVGSTGNSTGNHLHYEEQVDGKPRIPVFARNTGRVR